MYEISFESPVGFIALSGSCEFLTELSFSQASCICKDSANPLLLEGKKQVLSYLKGDLKEFSLPIALGGTAFQQKVWRSLLQIPYGHTCSYEELGALVGCEKGFRAVGNANGKNPLPLILPCHRVIRKNGDLGGYSGGVQIKKELLMLENNDRKKNMRYEYEINH